MASRFRHLQLVAVGRLRTQIVDGGLLLCADPGDKLVFRANLVERNEQMLFLRMPLGCCAMSIPPLLTEKIFYTLSGMSIP